jgi:hypothetical protein
MWVKSISGEEHRVVNLGMSDCVDVKRSKSGAWGLIFWMSNGSRAEIEFDSKEDVFAALEAVCAAIERDDSICYLTSEAVK